MISAQINSLVVAEKYDYALDLLDKNSESYGEKNQLLYWLDYGLLLHLAGQYEKSNEAFEEAKRIFDQYFTVSLSNQGATWLINDNVAPYRGEDFERVLINIFEAINYLQLGNIEEALVEARDVDSKLKVINSQYKPGEQNVYKEDAFTRMFMGILYELSATTEGLDNALIAYKNALKIYEEDFKSNYGVNAPMILKENLLAVANKLGVEESKILERRYVGLDYKNLDFKNEKAEVYLINYYGLSPIKHQASVVVPVPRGYIYRLAFPSYDKREYADEYRSFVAQVHNNKKEKIMAPLEIVYDFESIAIQNLENRRLRVLAKASTRSTAKYFLAKTEEDVLRSKYNDDVADAFKYVSNIFNIASEQPDLRSWQTLPAQITMARLVLEPGEYEFFIDKKLIGQAELKQGEKKFFVYRMTE